MDLMGERESRAKSKAIIFGNSHVRLINIGYQRDDAARTRLER